MLIPEQSECSCIDKQKVTAYVTVNWLCVMQLVQVGWIPQKNLRDRGRFYRLKSILLPKPTECQSSESNSKH